MKKKRHIKISKLKLGMIFLVFSMFIGFAALNTNLKFNGSTSLAYLGDQDFKIYFSRTFINDVGKSNIINEEKNAFSFTYSDINHRNADLKYTVKNTSNSYYADVEISCKSRKNDGTSFLYNEDDYVSQRFRLEPGRSQTKDIKLLLPESTNDDSSNSVVNVNLAEYVKGLSKGSDSNINFNNLKENGVYETTNTNTGNPVYYYRGETEKVNNDVIFAEKCWKILRTSENGGVKLVYNGNPVGGSCLTFGAALGIQSDDDIIEISNSAKYNNNAYAGYMYGSLNASDYSTAHQNVHDSIFKQRVDAWYEKFILNTVYEQFVIDDLYNNDRALLEDYSKVTSDIEYDGLGYGTHTSLYESAGRVSHIAKDLSPTYKISNKNDVYSVSDTENGNGALNYPISVINADDLVYAGTTNEPNTRSWLHVYGRFLLTMSPVGYYNDTMNFVVQNGSGSLDTIPVDGSTDRLYVLPTITISSELNILSGDGSNANPFILSSEDVYENSYTCTLKVNKVGYSEDLEPRNPLLDLEVGEEYCFGDECFYTISNDQNGKIKMIAKYNLYVGNYYKSASDHPVISKTDPLYGKQHSSALGLSLSGGYPRIGTINYSKNANDNSYANSVVKPYVDEYVSYLKELTGINISGELITRDELLSLGCSANPSTCNTASFDWVTGITYWTMSPGDTNKKIYLVGADGYFNASTGMDNVDQRGVRPVITVNVATKNPNVTFVTGNGESVGDELCIGDECFYVLNYDGDNYTLFSKYNLYVGNKFDTGSRTPISTSVPEYGKQNSLALGDKGSPIYGTLNYADSIKAINNYATYMNSTYGLHVTGRAITYDELVNTIGCQDLTGSGINHGCSMEKNPSVKYEWVTDTTYWTGATNGDNVYIVGGDGFFKAVATANQDNRGARPVIVVPALEIKSPDYVVPSGSYPSSWDDNGVFSEYYDKAYATLKTMSTEEKVGQLLVMSYSTQADALNAIQNYHVGGVLFFDGAFTGKDEAAVKQMTSDLQVGAKVPLAMAVDEEGGRVVRISPNLNLVSNEVAQYPNIFYTNSNNKNAWKLSSDLYKDSGNNFELIKQETVVKSSVLKRLGLNVNFAPVVDMAVEGSYISDRIIGLDANGTGEYAQAVINSSKGTGVSYALKHFPGYGNNGDTHGSSSIDNKTKEELMNNDVIPFKMGIEAGAPMVMIAHNTVVSIDANNPASLSYPIHEILFEELGFTGLAVTDDLNMDAIKNNITNQYIKAFTAGNHILLSSSAYATAHNEILTAVNSGNIPMTDLNKRVFKILAWKYYIGILS